MIAINNYIWIFGENLGKTNINSTMDKAADYAEKVRSDLSGKANDGQNTDN